MAKLDKRALSERLAELKVSLMLEIERAATPLDAVNADSRRAAARASFQSFLETYLPHYFAGKRDYSSMHKDFFGDADLMFAGDKGAGLRLVRSAPRGNAKTTIAKGIALYALVFGLRKFVILISDALDQAVENLEAIKIELEGNGRLKADFPDVCGAGPVWNQGTAVTNLGGKIKAYGSGKRLRGVTHGVHRPDLVIVDDLENDENVGNPGQRKKGENWMLKSVVPLGPPDGSMDLLMLGTVLHYDAVLVRLAKNPGFAARTYRAILTMPARMDLWDEYERLYHTQGLAEAVEFYIDSREEMDRGAQVLWPQVQALRWLMTKRAEHKAAFSSEYQNNPIDESERIFDKLYYYEQLPPHLVYFGAVDPSMGKESRSADPSAIIVVGKDPVTGWVYVVVADISKLKPSAIIERVIELQVRYRCQLWVVEINQFQEFFKDTLVEKSAEQGVPVPARGVRSATDKGLRIESIQPHTNNGVILFSRNQQALIDQLTFYPKADHDDGPDALQMVFAQAHTRFSAGVGVLVAPSGAGVQRVDCGEF